MMAWTPADTVGDIDPFISDAKQHFRRYRAAREEGVGVTDTDDTYTEAFGRALVAYKAAMRYQVQQGYVSGPMPDLDPEFDWATKWHLDLPGVRIVPPTRPNGPGLRPLYVSVEGHLSDMWLGPAVEVGKILEREERVQLQPTFYNNGPIPFDNDSGVRMISSFFNNPALMPPGRKWCISGFSQGDIVVSEFLIRHVLPENGAFHHRLPDLVFGIEYGAPYRPTDVVAPWVADPPKAGTAGIDPKRMPSGAHLDRIRYVCRKGDMYTEVPLNGVGDKMRSVYNVVAKSDPKTLLFELMAVGINPTREILEIAEAIVHGTLFLLNMQPHGGYDLGPGINWAREMISAR